MADAIVRLVLEKLANLAANELNHLGTVGEKVKHLHEELIRIQCCLKDADTKHKGDARVQNWLNELRDVAYRIEDATDTFLVDIEDHCQKDPSQKDPCCFQNLKKVFHKSIKLGTELDNIRNKLERISKSRVDYGIIALQDIVGEAVIMPFQRATYQEVDETEVVGMETDKNNILKLLRPEETPRRAVITIVGTGGSGKTTLAHMVYEGNAREKFEYHIMLSISQQFNLIDLLSKMLQELKYSVPENPRFGDLICKLKSLLSRKRYLIILDDVWKEDFWIQLKEALPDMNNGSRVLMTSRNIDVAKSADSQMPPYKLCFLDIKKSLALLLKKALPYQEPDKDCPSELLEVAKKLSTKCKGLPLALIVLGGILLKKGPDYLKWERVLCTFDWFSDCEGCMDVLAMSYQDIPYYLKACFLYLASFPEDYEISAKYLIRMWIAEGFILYKGRATKEEMAENYLDELFERSMIQVSSRSIYGMIKSCKVHDLIRDLAMHEAREQNFVTVFGQASDVNQPNRETRRASLQYHELQEQQTNLQFVEYLGPNTRSLLLFGLGRLIGIQRPQFSNFRLLKVLDLVDVRIIDRNLAKEFEKLIHLKYLRFRNCQLVDPPKVRAPSVSFHCMKSLEILDLRGTAIRETNFSWAASILRHVQCDRYDLNGPNSTVDLPDLQTMKWVSVPSSWATKVPSLNNLRKLGVWSFGIKDWAAMTNLLGTLPSLLSLAIKLELYQDELPREIVYPKALPNYQNLQSLHLWGMWPTTTTLDASLFPPHLIKLTLGWCQVETNPMLELGKLKNLKKLSLFYNVIKSSVPTICSEGFPVLQCLIVTDVFFKELVVAKGVMPMLTRLQVHSDLKLYLPPELQHLDVWGKYSSLNIIK